MLVEALLAAPFPIVGIVMDYTYHRGTGRTMYADRLLEGAVAGARRVWSADKAPYARPIVELIKLAFYRKHETYRVAWTAANTLKIYHTRVTRYSRRAAVRAVRRQDWVRAAGRFVLLEVTIVPHAPTVLEAGDIPTVVEPPTSKTKKTAAPKRKSAPKKPARKRATTKREAVR